MSFVCYNLVTKQTFLSTLTNLKIRPSGFKVNLSVWCVSSTISKLQLLTKLWVIFLEVYIIIGCVFVCPVSLYVITTINLELKEGLQLKIM